MRGWMRALAASLLACCGAAGAAVAEPAKEVGRRYALVIGNSAYKNITPLRNPVNDSRALCTALGALRFETLCLHDVPDRRSLRDAVRNFTKRLKPEDVALFYFAGHGVELDGENFLIPTTADVPSRSYVEDETLRLGFIFEELREAKVRLSILILDACRDNPYGAVRSASGGGLSAPASVPAGSILIFPTAPGKVALDGTGSNGLFTSHLLRHLSSPGIAIEEMFKRVIGDVRAESLRYGREQVPWMNLSFTGEFCFVGCGTRVSTEQYLSLVREKQQVEQVTLDLQGKLRERQNEVLAFQGRMRELEQRLSRQEGDSQLSAAQQQALAAERQEFAAKVAQLQQQEAELGRLNGELGQLRREQAEFQRRESQMAMVSERVNELERLLSVQEQRGLGVESQAAENLRKERAELLRQQESNLVLRGELGEAMQKLERLQAALAGVDRQRQELESYRLRIVGLEQETTRKDAAMSAMRADLETRERELATIRDRLAGLQSQLTARTQDTQVSQAVLARLQRERDELLQSSRLLADRDRELRAAREQLLRLESRQVELEQREQEAGRHAQRVRELEARLAQAQQQRLPDSDTAALRQERQDLLARNETMRRQLLADREALKEQDLLRRRLQDYDRQQAELIAYKDRLADAEKRMKDAATSTVKGAAFVAPAL